MARDPDGTFEVLDGNTRLEELAAAGVESVPCVILDLPADERKAFALAHDRNRKLFDEDAVVKQLKELAGKEGADVAKLAALTATEGLSRLLAETERAGKNAVEGATRQSLGKVAAQASMVLYGPSEDVEAVRELLKRVKGRLGPLLKLRSTLEQAEAFEDLSSEEFLLCFAAALGRLMAVRTG